MAVVLIALFLAAWKDDAPGSAFLVLLGVALALKLGFVLAILGKGRARWSWLAFALAGLAYLVASLAPPSMPTDRWIAAFDRMTSPEPSYTLPNDLSDLSWRENSGPRPRLVREGGLTVVDEDLDGLPDLYLVSAFTLSDPRRSLGHSALTVFFAVAAGLPVLALPGLIRKFRRIADGQPPSEGGS